MKIVPERKGGGVDASVLDDIAQLREDVDNLIVGSSSNGGVFVLDVVPTSSGAVSDKQFMEDGRTLTSFLTSTNLVTLKIVAFSGHSSYVPTIMVNGTKITLAVTSVYGVFTCDYPIDLGEDTNKITLTHSDGPEISVNVVRDVLPQVVSALIEQSYPGSQTELKAGDTLYVNIVTSVPVNKIVFQNQGISTGQTFNVTPGTNHRLTLTAPNRGTTATAHIGRIVVSTDTGAESSPTDTGNSIILNNRYPAIAFSNVVYPSSQQALKNSETAVVNHTVQYFDSINYSSENSTISIQNPTQYEPAKTVTRIAGDYVVTNNLTVSATRNANGAISIVRTTVKIANVLPTLVMTKSAARFKSGGNLGTSIQLHQITLTSDQDLIEAPSVSIPVGNLGAVGGGPKAWIFPVSVHDDMVKGIYSLVLNQAKGLSGLTTNVISGSVQYELGGFAKRTFYIAPFPVRSAEIGVMVVDTTKLRCTNLGKGLSGSYNFSYQDTTAEAVNKYTILDGHTWYNCDGVNASSNTTGLLQIELEEIV